MINLELSLVPLTMKCVSFDLDLSQPLTRYFDAFGIVAIIKLAINLKTIFSFGAGICFLIFYFWFCFQGF